MSATSKFRGHDIVFKNEEWIFKSTGLSTVETHMNMPCGHCGKGDTKEGHDGCLGTLIGLMNACCGHGENRDAYVQFLDGEGVYGEDAITIIKILKKHENSKKG